MQIEFCIARPLPHRWHYVEQREHMMNMNQLYKWYKDKHGKLMWHRLILKLVKLRFYPDKDLKIKQGKVEIYSTSIVIGNSEASAVASNFLPRVSPLYKRQRQKIEKTRLTRQETLYVHKNINYNFNCFLPLSHPHFKDSHIKCNATHKATKAVAHKGHVDCISLYNYFCAWQLPCCWSAPQLVL